MELNPRISGSLYASLVAGVPLVDDLISLSKKKFEYVIRNYPATDFAQDAKFKINLIQDVLASKEMYIGKYYLIIAKNFLFCNIKYSKIFILRLLQLIHSTNI